MSDSPELIEQQIDATDLTMDQLLIQLEQLDSNCKIQIVGAAEREPGCLAGLNKACEITVQGSIGRFGLMASQQATVVVAGNADSGCGHSLQSGSILIRGDVGNYLAAYAVGGYLAVHGRARDFVGYCLSGADVLVRSRSGNCAGARMRSGTLVLGNGCGEELGKGMSGGTIYVRGEIGSIAPSVQMGRMKETDSIRLSLMLVRAGIKTTLEKFQVFRTRGDRG